jgi:hypothetical protein
MTSMHGGSAREAACCVGRTTTSWRMVWAVRRSSARALGSPCRRSVAPRAAVWTRSVPQRARSAARYTSSARSRSPSCTHQSARSMSSRDTGSTAAWLRALHTAGASDCARTAALLRNIARIERSTQGNRSCAARWEPRVWRHSRQAAERPHRIAGGDERHKGA